MYVQIIYKDLWNPETEASVQVLQHHITELQSETGCELWVFTRCVCVCVSDYLLEGLELIYAGIHAFFRPWQSSGSCRGLCSLTSCCTTNDTQTFCTHDVASEDECVDVFNGKWPDLLGLKLQNKNLSWSQLLDQFCQEFSVVGDEQSLWFSLICVFVSPTWFSHTDGPPLCKTTSSPTLWPICEVTEQRWERCTIFLALVLWYIFFYGRNFRQIWSSREVKPAACDSVELQLDRWWNDLLIYNKGALHYLHTSLCYLQNNIHTIMFFLSFIMSLFYFDSAPSSCVHLHLSELPHLTCVIWTLQCLCVNFALWFLRYYCDIYRYFKQQGNWIN